MRNLKVLNIAAVLLTVGVFFVGCAWRAPFNQYSFDETARLKAESTALIRKASRSYALNEGEAEALLESIQRAYQDSRLRALNAESMRQWMVIIDAEQASVAGALNRWRLNDTLSAAERVQFQNTIAKNFDDISKLEGGKKK